MIKKEEGRGGEDGKEGGEGVGVRGSEEEEAGGE